MNIPILGLCDIKISSSVEGIGYSPFLKKENKNPPDAVRIENINPFGEMTRAAGEKEYRGIRTGRYTFVLDLKGPCLLFDNECDPYQLNNLCNDISYESDQIKLDE